jgi:hypothetical protein
MTVVVTEVGYLVRLGGTIAEVLNKLKAFNVTGDKIVYYEDDGTNAKSLFSKV